jgi:hypothetical protein
LSKRTPDEVLRRLVLARRSNTITAFEELSLFEENYADDDELIETILWKLGFDVDSEKDVNDDFWKHHARMKNVTQTASISAIVDQEEVRRFASNYFVALEGILDDSLAYCTWALTSDHFRTSRPFNYRLDIDRSEAFIRLNEVEAGRPSGPERITFGERNELYPLCRGYGILAYYLKTLAADANAWKRPIDELPKYTQYSRLHNFPFGHTVSFLDLVPDAQDRLLAILRDLSTQLVATNVSELRNEWLHYRRATADVARLVESLSTIERVVETLEREGLARVLYRLVRQTGDRWGRRIYVLGDRREERQIAIARPSPSLTPQMPSLRSAQYLMIAAVFDEPSEMLRFTSSVSSEYTGMWDGFPRRREGGRLETDDAVGNGPLTMGGGARPLPE